jgi:PPOX class probable F420-dependent enzyme
MTDQPVVRRELSTAAYEFLATARVGRLATVTKYGRPHAVPICFALVEGALVSPLDEKAKTVGPRALRRVRNVAANPHVAVVVDRYVEDWSQLCWVQVRGRASILDPDAETHAAGVAALHEKYDQYDDHALDDRPAIRIDPVTVASWGEFPEA